MSLTARLIVLLVLALLFGGWRALPRRRSGYYSWSPAAIIPVVLLILLLTGKLALS